MRWTRKIPTSQTTYSGGREIKLIAQELWKKKKKLPLSPGGVACKNKVLSHVAQIGQL